MPARSSLVGHPRGEWDLSDYPDVNIVTVTNAAADRPVAEGELAVGDRLTVVGVPDGVTRFGADRRLELRAVRDRDVEVAQGLIRTGHGTLSEVGRAAADRGWSARSADPRHFGGAGRAFQQSRIVLIAVQRQGAQPEAGRDDTSRRATL